MHTEVNNHFRVRCRPEERESAMTERMSFDAPLADDAVHSLSEPCGKSSYPFTDEDSPS